MKAAPVMRALETWPDARQTLVHTGQHYDWNLSDIFFSQLNMRAPEVNFEVGSGSHAVQTAEVMKRFEAVVLERKPDLVLVYGDVNSTVATALVCSKLRIRVGHVEAGLRSFDRTMPEEVNRIVTDQLADVLFTPAEDGDVNLQREGVPAEKIYRVGNVMIDSLVQLQPAIMRFSKNGLPQRYALVTLHRPSNVDDSANLTNIVESLLEVNERLEVVFPVHPRTRQRIDRLGINIEKLRFLGPLPYIEFLSLQRRAVVVITDPGGVQEETTYLGVPCLTLGSNTERPVTVDMGTNVLIGQDPGLLDSELTKILEGGAKKGSIPPLWDGRASERIVQALREYLASMNQRVRWRAKIVVCLLLSDQSSEFQGKESSSVSGAFPSDISSQISLADLHR